MKKKIIKLLVCTGLICMALTGCEDKKSEVKNEEKVENNQDVGADVQDILDEATALEDGEYSVGFKPEDVIEKNGTYHLKIDLYSCNHYSKEEIENLKEGSIISICDKDVEVKKVEKNEKGIYVVRYRIVCLCLR